MGTDLTDHETQPLTEPLVRHADVIYTMTRSHRDAIVAQWPGAAERMKMLCADESDVCDPIGGPAGTLSALRRANPSRIGNPTERTGTLRTCIRGTELA